MRKLDPRFELAWTIHRRRVREYRLLMPAWIIGGMAFIGLCGALVILLRLEAQDSARAAESVLAIVILAIAGAVIGAGVGGAAALLAMVVLRVKRWKSIAFMLLVPEFVWVICLAALAPFTMPTQWWAIAWTAPLAVMIAVAWKVLPNERFQCRPGTCPVCGYELLGIDEHGCTECGWER